MNDDWVSVDFDSHIYSNWKRLSIKLEHMYIKKGLPELLYNPRHSYNLRKLERRNISRKKITMDNKTCHLDMEI